MKSDIFSSPTVRPPPATRFHILVVNEDEPLRGSQLASYIRRIVLVDGLAQVEFHETLPSVGKAREADVVILPVNEFTDDSLKRALALFRMNDRVRIIFHVTQGGAQVLLPSGSDVLGSFQDYDFATLELLLRAAIDLKKALTT